MYDVTTDEQSRAQLDALPSDALAAFAEARVVVELSPWSGEPFNHSYPDAPVRTLAFGPDRRGLITYLILEEMRRVDLLVVVWLA